ncbi:MAG: deazaflavin-dependent nitroreductase [Thermoleophilia bacterium]
MMRRPRVQFGLPAGAVNRLMTLLVGRLGLPIAGIWMLHTADASGREHVVPVIPVTHRGREYLVAPRGMTRWVRQLTDTGHGALTRGRRTRPVTATAVHGRDRVPVLAAYVSRNHRRNGEFFDIEVPFTRDDLMRIAPRHPVVRIDRAP